MILIGTIASSLLQNVDNGVMDALQVITVGPSGASSVTFSNIPQTYDHLQIRSLHKQSGSSYAEITLNSGSWARRHYLYGDGSSAFAGSDTANAMFATNTGYFFATICDLLDYTSTNKNRVYRVLNGGDNNGSGIIHLFSGLDTTTTATTSITITPTGGGSFSQYSQFALYGVKGAA